MRSFSKIQTADRIIGQLQDNISNALTPILKNPQVDGYILSKVTLVSGSNLINHGLDRELQGWFIVRQRASASIYDAQDSNATPAKTLILTSSAGVVVDIYVF